MRPFAYLLAAAGVVALAIELFRDFGTRDQPPALIGAGLGLLILAKLLQDENRPQ